MRQELRKLYLELFGTIKNPKPGIHILNSHFISACNVDLSRDTETYERFLNFLSKTCKFINIEDAVERIIRNDIPKKEVLIAFTFDDGFEECYTVIAPLLEKYNCRGTFFISANYINSDETYQKDFNERTKTFTKTPMTWKQVKDLHSRGHLIGSHTLDHVDLTKVDEKNALYQLAKNKKILEAELNYKCEYFAWTYGRMQFFSEELLRLSMLYYKYIFSTTNYKNYFSFNGRVLNRRTIEAFYPKSHIRYFLSFNKKHNK